MEYTNIVYWTGLLFWFAFFLLFATGLMWCLFWVVRQLFVFIFVWFAYGEFDTWWTYRQFRDRYRYLHGNVCPHCGGSGVKDNDKECGHALKALQSYIERRRIRAEEGIKGE